MARKITEQGVRNLKPRERKFTIAEDGLQVEVHPTGRKSLYWKFRQGGRQHREKLGEHPELTVKAARERVRELQLKLTRTTTPRQGATTFREYVEGDFKARIEVDRRSADATIARVKHQFYPYMENVRLRDITPEHCESWRAAAVRRDAPSTVKGNVALLKRVFNLAVEQGYLRVSPARSLRAPTVDSQGTKLYLSESEYERLQAAVNLWEYRSRFGTPLERRYHPLWFVLYVKIILNTGARRNEALQLTWGDIDPEERLITFKGDRTKSQRTRQVPISDKLAQELAHFAPDEDIEETDRVFPVDYVQKPWRRLMDMAELDIGIHHLRHHFASTLVLRGAALSTVRDLLGHSSLEVTSRYLSVRTKDKAEAVNLL